MKTAEQWTKEEGGVFEGEAGELRGFVEHSVLQHIELVRAIQSDAIESTVRKCAALEPEKGFQNTFDSDAEIHAYLAGWGDAEKAILSLIPQKEKKV